MIDLTERHSVRVNGSALWPGDAIALYWLKAEDGKLFAASSPKWEEVKTGQITPATVAIDSKAAQQLIDELWAAGFRPAAGAGTAGAMDAAQKHLQDMRKTVSHSLGVEL